MAALGLPRYALLKSNLTGKFVSHTSDSIRGYLRANMDDATSPNCKIELEMAQTGGGLVNIRSCYNNKYWRRVSSGGVYIVAAADVPDEDRSHWDSTLFEVIRDKTDPKTFQLTVLATNRIVGISISNSETNKFALFSNLHSSENTKPRTKFTIEDWESLLILPRRVAFVGDNDKYLRVVVVFIMGRYPYIKFDGDDLGLRGVSYEITNVPDARIRLKSHESGKFWKLSASDYITADSVDESHNDNGTLFRAAKGGGNNNNSIALRNLGNDLFCSRHSTSQNKDFLNSNSHSITRGATLAVEEPVFSRSVYNVVYRLGDSRVYDQSISTVVSKDAANHNTEPEVHQVRLTYKKTVSSTWSRSVSVTTSVTTSLQAKVPIIGSGSIEITVSTEGSLEWSKTEESSEEVETIQTVTVPPRSRVTVSIVASRARSDVPFSYSQRDVLTNGETVIYAMDDGLFTGVNSYNFDSVTSEPEPL